MWYPRIKEGRNTEQGRRGKERVSRKEGEKERNEKKRKWKEGSCCILRKEKEIVRVLNLNQVEV